jgi:Arc/MetJ-type ribon-helix-helix transcriptional regulator
MKSLRDILNGITSDRRAKIEARTEALRQALIEGEESGEDSPLDMKEIRHEAQEEAGLL